MLRAACRWYNVQGKNEPAKKKRKTTKKKAVSADEEEEEKEDHEATESEGEESSSDFEEAEKPSKKRKAPRRPKKSRAVESDNEEEDEGEKEKDSAAEANKDEEQPAAEPEEEADAADKEDSKPETAPLDADVCSKVRDIIAHGNAEELTVKKSSAENNNRGTPHVAFLLCLIGVAYLVAHWLKTFERHSIHFLTGSIMGKKSKSKAAPVAEPETPALKPEVVEVVKQQVQHQDAAALADGFAQSAAFFGKKASYASAAVETPAKQPEAKETNADDDKKKIKKEKKKSKKNKKKQDAEEEEGEKETEKQEKQEKTEEETEEPEDGEKKKKKKKKHKKKKTDEEEKEEPEELTPEQEKNRRTVFVGNVSLDATQKDIKNHFSGCGKVESVRLRHLPIAGCAVDQAGNQKLMMKVCAIKKILTTAKDNCNAYVTFVEKSSVEAALKLNGTTLVEKKIRVDRCDPVIDARRSVFIGNVPLKCTDEQMLQFFAKRLRTEEEPDPIENVRLIRDRESGLGKGFGYLLLKTPALVAQTLALRDLKMETRELRVQVCGKRFKNNRGEETAKEKFEGLRASAGARARIQLKRKAGAENLEHGLTTKKMKRTAAAAGLGKKLKPKHAARKAAKAAAEAAAAAAKGKKRKHDHSNSKKVEKAKTKKPKHTARKAEKAAKAKK
ncbi:unnamed protein product [Phytophthora lilii]|uniref:Unnamed protein product n=1 Tax=Phytophthora lilii TaxID=2077276 RepID=A0A9W6XHK5_9STRA|nr:unnamed protein product [Phytophthora lilii]